MADRQETAEICEKCHDGEIEPKECEYYGEPNGCNSPIYGQHPKSKPCGNSAALREAIVHMIDTADSIAIRNPAGAIGKLAFHIKQTGDAALAAPARNCDVGDAADWEKRFGEECDKGHACSNCPVRHAKTRMAIELDKGARCEFAWAQMPYEDQEGVAK